MASNYSLLDFKRQRVDAVRDFPKGCGARNNFTLCQDEDEAVKFAGDSQPNQHNPPPKSSHAKGAGYASYGKSLSVLSETSVRDDERTDREYQPLKPSSSVGAGRSKCTSLSRLVEDDDDDNCRKKIQQALHMFLEVQAKYLEEGKHNCRSIFTPVGKAHVAAAKYLREIGKWVNESKQFGHVPGVRIGDEFRYVAELNIVGLHHQFWSGIDYMMKGGKVFATSIIATGRYQNEIKASNTLIYSGAGGHCIFGKIPKDQVLERGNLALKNSMDAGSPVRVILGIKTSNKTRIKGKNSGNTIYVYDGLYHVISYYQERGQFDKLVFKFPMRRMDGQPNVVLGKLVGKTKISTSPRNMICMNDISQGKEKFPIQVVNQVDNERPPCFNYMTKLIYPDYFNPYVLSSCGCNDGCRNPAKCACLVKNGGLIPYDHNGCIVISNAIIYECSPSCKCSSSCTNKVSQNGIRFQLEVFRTNAMQWGVRSRSYIPKGSFICEYIGEVLQDDQARSKMGKEELVGDSCGRRGNSFFQLKSDLSSFARVGKITINASKYGNVGRFICPSNSPNLCARSVLYDHKDVRLPHIVLYAMKDIPPLRQLTCNIINCV